MQRLAGVRRPGGVSKNANGRGLQIIYEETCAIIRKRWQMD
jgi:hypothetical protein